MKRRSRLFLPLAVAALLAGCGDTPAERYASAQASFAAQDFGSARNALITALQDEPENRAMLELMAQAQLRLGDGEGALATAGRLRALGMAGPDLARIEAEAELHRGRHQEALARLGSDRTPSAWRIRAAAHLGLGEPLTALAAFESGIAAGGDFRLLADYAAFRMAANDIPEAERLVAQLRRMEGEGLETLMLSARLALQRTDFAQALKDATRAATRYPAQVGPLLAQAEALEGLGKLDEAAATAEKAAGLAGESPAVAAMVLRIAAMRGKWQDVRTALLPDEPTLSPTTPEGMLYAEALLNLGYAEQARAILNRTVLLQPANTYARGLLARAQLAGNDAEGAFRTMLPVADMEFPRPEELELLEKAARAARYFEADEYRARLQSAEYRRQAGLLSGGEAALQRRDWATALTSYRQLAALREDVPILIGLAYAASKAGSHAEAIAAADRLLAREPANPEAMKIAAMVRIDGGTDLPRAQALLRQALEQWPGSLELSVLLAKTGAAAG